MVCASLTIPSNKGTRGSIFDKKDFDVDWYKFVPHVQQYVLQLINILTLKKKHIKVCKAYWDFE